jgi:phosphatidylserine/phosphatidylglycerophosphate/cardiolipin synthase-like enzyme
MRRLLPLLFLAALAPAPAEELPATGTVEVLFTPGDDAEGALLRVVRGARHTIRVQAFLLTSKPLARALMEAHGRGVKVEVLTDREMVAKGEGSQIPQLHGMGIPIGLEVRYAAAHNKILLVDAEGNDPVVATGSFNYTFSAQARNAENLIILRGNQPLADAYLANWRRHRDQSVPYPQGLKR